MMISIDGWLDSIGLVQYGPAFTAENIEPDDLRELTEHDLERLGVTLGHRKRMLRSLAGRTEEEPAAEIDGPEFAGARRQITVAFCDLVGSTALAGRLDPEDLRAVIVAYHQCCADVVATFDGYVAQYLGDGVMVSFGFPLAHEDDVERSVRYSLAMIEAVDALVLAGGIRLQTRVGIATGTEVVGDLPQMSRDRASVVGTTPSLASRFQGIAAPSTVVIGPETRRLLGDAFTLESLGTHVVKGLESPTELWHVVGERVGASRFAARSGTRSTSFVGRDTEIALLADRARTAHEGEGQIVLLRGDAGVGKSRILEEFVCKTLDDASTIVRLQCSPHHAVSAMYPLVSMVEGLAHIVPSDTTAERFAKLEAFGASGQTSALDVDALALLLALPGASERPTLRSLTTVQRKTQIFRTILDGFVNYAKRGLLLVAIEDVHWIDPTTLEFVTRLVDEIRRRRMLVVATARPEFASPWIHHGNLRTLALNRLGRASVASIVANVCGDELWPADLVERIVERTDGIPLFAEELTRTLLESAAQAGFERTIPMTLRDALAARLDALGSAREIAQVAAVVGRDFSHAIMAAVVDVSEEVLTRELERLVASGLVLDLVSLHGRTYSFKHALVRDAAYEGLLRRQRTHLHLKVARAIERIGSNSNDVEPEIAAYHFEEGGAFVEGDRVLASSGRSCGIPFGVSRSGIASAACVGSARPCSGRPRATRTRTCKSTGRHALRTRRRHVADGSDDLRTKRRALGNLRGRSGNVRRAVGPLL